MGMYESLKSTMALHDVLSEEVCQFMAYLVGDRDRLNYLIEEKILDLCKDVISEGMPRAEARLMQMALQQKCGIK